MPIDSDRTRSFAQGTPGTNLNIVLWRWNGEGSTFDVIDNEDRLGRM